MSKSKPAGIHPRIQLALAVGASIVALAYFSKRVLPEPLSYLELALPPFIAMVYEVATAKNRTPWYSQPMVGVMAVVLTTALVILLNL